MPFQKGHAKAGGIKKGQTHTGSGKRTVREIVEAHYNKTLPEKMLELAGSNPETEIDVLKTLMPYAYPKLVATEMKIDAGAETSSKVDQLIDMLASLKADS